MSYRSDRSDRRDDNYYRPDDDRSRGRDRDYNHADRRDRDRDRDYDDIRGDRHADTRSERRLPLLNTSANEARQDSSSLRTPATSTPSSARRTGPASAVSKPTADSPAIKFEAVILEIVDTMTEINLLKFQEAQVNRTMKERGEEYELARSKADDYPSIQELYERGAQKARADLKILQDKKERADKKLHKCLEEHIPKLFPSADAHDLSLRIKNLEKKILHLEKKDMAKTTALDQGCPTEDEKARDAKLSQLLSDSESFVRSSEFIAHQTLFSDHKKEYEDFRAEFEAKERKHEQDIAAIRREFDEYKKERGQCDGQPQDAQTSLLQELENFKTTTLAELNAEIGKAMKTKGGTPTPSEDSMEFHKNIVLDSAKKAFNLKAQQMDADMRNFKEDMQKQLDNLGADIKKLNLSALHDETSGSSWTCSVNNRLKDLENTTQELPGLDIDQLGEMSEWFTEYRPGFQNRVDRHEETISQIQNSILATAQDTKVSVAADSSTQCSSEAQARTLDAASVMPKDLVSQVVEHEDFEDILNEKLKTFAEDFTPKVEEVIRKSLQGVNERLSAIQAKSEKVAGDLGSQYTQLEASIPKLKEELSQRSEYLEESYSVLHSRVDNVTTNQLAEIIAGRIFEIQPDRVEFLHHRQVALEQKLDRLIAAQEGAQDPNPGALKRRRTEELGGMRQ